MRQRTLIPVAVLAILGLTFAAAAEERVLTGTFPAAGISSMKVTNGVGDVAITAASVSDITVEVTLIPRRGGLFSSYRHAQDEVDSAKLASRTNGNELVLGLESSSNEPRFEARWVVVMPADIAVGLEAGVGDVTIRGLAAGVDLEVGVGDAVIEVTGGSIDLEVGVGDATVQGPANAYGDVEASGGVGSSDLVVRDQRVSGEGFVGQSSSWRGDGPHAISVEVGVGDARVRLD